MAKKQRIQFGPRDESLLMALDQSPFTASQLLQLSDTFERPFSDLHALRRRLRQLSNNGFIRAYPYAIVSLGRSPSYYRLTLSGYRQLYGLQAPLPSRRVFQAVADANHSHTFALAEFLVSLFRAVERNGGVVRNYERENTVLIDTPSITLRADAAFDLCVPDRPPLKFVVELDNGTERIRSQRDVESIERKVRGYIEHQSSVDVFDRERYVVLFVTTRSALRLDGILAACRALTRNPRRRLFLGTSLAEFQSASDPLFGKVFRGLDRRSEALIPPASRRKEPVEFQPTTTALC